MAYAHELVHAGKRLLIVHRDVSPHNIMVSWDGGVKLVDFGVAKTDGDELGQTGDAGTHE